MEAIWKPVKGMEDFFACSTNGEVKSLPRDIKMSNGAIRPHKGKILTPYTNKHGYRKVTMPLGIKGGRKIFVHRIIAMTFIPNPNNYPIINHKNSNPSDNRVENIEWCTPQQNAKHGYEKGLIKRPIPTHHLTGERKEMRKPVDVFDVNCNHIGRYQSLREAAKELGTGESSIWRVLNGVRKMHRKMIFKYAPKVA